MSGYTGPDRRAKPLTPTQRLHEVTMQALSRSPRTPQESVEMTRNAKGDVQFTVAGATQEDETLEDCVTRIRSIWDELNENYALSRAQVYDRNTEPPARVKGKP